jgi:hypothetical protein
VTLTFIVLIALIELPIFAILIARAIVFTRYGDHYTLDYGRTTYFRFVVYGPLSIVPLHMALLWAIFVRGIIARKALFPDVKHTSKLPRDSPTYLHHQRVFLGLGVTILIVSLVIFALSLLDGG